MACTNDKQEIGNTIRNFYGAYQNQEYSRALGYISSQERAVEGDRKILETLQSSRFWSGFSKIKSIGEPTIVKNNARVWIDVEGLLGFVDSKEVYLVKEGNHWKISHIE